jgi:hypothetical protein
MRRKVAIVMALLLAIVAGVASASLVTAGTAAEQPSSGRYELPSGDVRTGDPVPDTHGGPPWAVRIFDGDTSLRCIVAGRTDGEAFGPVDARGEIADRGAVASGSCLDPAAEPVQAAVMRFAETAGTGPRSVLFGVAAPDVTRVEVVAPGVSGPVTLDSARTFIVVSDGLTVRGGSTVAVTLSDGSTRFYAL